MPTGLCKHRRREGGGCQRNENFWRRWTYSKVR